jgi:aminoglycoside phosphotransferase (APT) family kinase protein
MDRLWRSAARERGDLQVAEPLAFRPEAGLLLQVPAPGRPLRPDRNQQLFRQLVEHAATSLAVVHTADISVGEPLSLGELVRELRQSLEQLAYVAPLLCETLRKLIDRIAPGSHSGARVRVPSHGDFKWDQFLHKGGQFTLVDFESFCQAEPEYDVGTFCAYLHPPEPEDWAESAAAEALRSLFLRRYEERADRAIELPRLARYEATALAFRALAHAWAQQPAWEWRTSQLLDLAMERLVDPPPGKFVRPLVS